MPAGTYAVKICIHRTIVCRRLKLILSQQCPALALWQCRMITSCTKAPFHPSGLVVP